MYPVTELLVLLAPPLTDRAKASRSEWTQVIIPNGPWSSRSPAPSNARSSQPIEAVLSPRDCSAAWLRNAAIGLCALAMDRLALPVAEHEAVITPSFALTDPASGDVRLLGMVSDDSPVTRVRGSDWPATPADRLAQLCRIRGVELGLATDGRWWALVWSPAGGVTTVAVFDAVSWGESSERTVVRAFISLLQRRRFFAVPESRQLPALLRESLKHGEDITEALGVQVRQAVELLVAAFARSDVSAETRAAEVYRGAVTVMMRHQRDGRRGGQALWLVSMGPGRPFTFLDDKLAVGDSLLGITSIEQLEWMHLNPAEGRKLHEDTLLDFMSGVRGVLADVSEQRRLQVDIPDDIDGIAKKREILDEVRSKTKDLSLYADLLAGAALRTSAGWARRS